MQEIICKIENCLTTAFYGWFFLIEKKNWNNGLNNDGIFK